jgi:hypothetical protein
MSKEVQGNKSDDRSTISEDKPSRRISCALLNTWDHGDMPPRNNSVASLTCQDSSSAMIDPFVRSDSLMARKRLSSSWRATYADTLETADNLHHDGMAELLAASKIKTSIPNIIDAMRRIVAVAEDNIEAKAFIISSGTLGLAMHFAAVHILDAGIQIAACKLLTCAAVDDDHVQEEIGSLEGIDAILEAMMGHRETPEVQQAAVHALSALMWGQTNRATMLRHGAMIDIVEAMKANPKNAVLLEAACGVIAQVVYGRPESRRLVGAAGGVEAIIVAMKTYPTKLTLQAHACFALRNLVWKCPQNRAIMLRHDADTLLMATMEAFPKIPGLQDQALVAIESLVEEDIRALQLMVPTDSLRKPIQFLIMSTLRVFTNNKSIVANALSLLLTVCEVAKINRMALIKQVAELPSAGNIICASIRDTAVRSFASVLDVVSLLKLLCVVSSFQRSVASAGGIPLLLDCLEQYIETNAESCGELFDGLNAIVSGSDENKRSFNSACNGVSRVSSIMLKHPHIENVQLLGCNLLDNISNGQHEATAENMSNRQDAMKAVIAAMASYPMAAKLQEYGCSVMIKVAASTPEDSNELVHAGANPIVEKARTSHAGNPAVESLANQLLTLLVSSDSSREGRGGVARGNASVRLRSRSRAVEKGARSRSRMDNSKSPVKDRGRGLAPVDENSTPEDIDEQEAKAMRRPGTKPVSQRSRRGGRDSAASTLEAVPE